MTRSPGEQEVQASCFPLFLEYRKKHRVAEQNTDIVLTMICEYGKLQNGYSKVTTGLQFHILNWTGGMDQ